MHASQKLSLNHDLAITTIDVATLISILRPISEDKGISYPGIAKIEKETQCRLCSSPSQASGRGKQMPASKKKDVPRKSQNAGNGMAFRGFLAMKVFGRVGGQCSKSR
jgi:hypothetical protein